MKRQGIIIIVFALLFCLSLCAYFIFVRPLTAVTDETEEESVETEEGESLGTQNRFFMFASLERSDIATITIDNEYGSYTFEGDGKGEFHIRGYDSVSYDTELFATLLNISTYTLSKAKVGSNLSAEKMAEYGLDEPKASWTVTDKRGSSYKVFVGDRLLTGGGYYCRLEGRSSVYVLGIDVENTILVPVESYVLAVLSAGISQDDYYLTDDFTVYKKGEELFSLRLVDKDEMVNQNAMAEVIMDYPTEYYPNTSTYYELLYSYMYLAGDSCYKLGASEEDFKATGLLEPETTITFVYNKTRYELHFSEKTENDTYYAYSNLYPNIIAECSAENLSYLEYSLIDWIDEYVFQQYVTNISTMTVETDKAACTFDLYHSFAEDGDPVLDVKVEGEQFTDEQVANFRQYYKSFLAIAIQDYYANDEYCKLTEEEMEALVSDEDNAYMTFTYTTRKGETTRLCFYNYSTRHSVVTVNGVGEFYVLTDVLKKVENDTLRILAGETITAFDKN